MKDLLDIDKLLNDKSIDDKVRDIAVNRKRRLVALYSSADSLYRHVSGISDQDMYDCFVSEIIAKAKQEGFQWDETSNRGEHPRTLYFKCIDELRKHIVSEVCKDLLSYVKQIDRVIFNERDLQLYLSDRLKSSGHYDNVYLEYHLPKGVNSKFDEGYADWETECPSIDIVLEIGDRFIAIELKNKLKSFSTNLSRLGESANVQILKNQSAQNIGRYQFWKDVKRLELLKQSYKNVLGGVALFLTNDNNYQKTTSNADYAAFGMEEDSPKGGKNSKPLDWVSPIKKGKNGEELIDKSGNPIRKSPAIKLDETYSPAWDEAFAIDKEKFHCCYVIV